nr:ATP-dependent metallopeptidase FtsH/Yme1/Tma family protein [Pseudoxanthomonas sp.]
MNDLTKNLLLWVVVAVVLMVVFQSFSPRGGTTGAAVAETPSYTRFLADVDAGKIRSVVFTDESTFTANAIRYKRSDGTEGQVVGPMDGKLVDQLVSKNVDVIRERPKTGPGFWGLVLN